MKKVITLLAALIGSTSLASADECGKVTLADMNWASATTFANIDKFILENGYGCDVELVVGDTTVTGTSMTEKGTPDVAPELWTNSFIKAIELGVQEKRLRMAGSPLPDGGEEGFWVPKYMVDENPKLATIAGILANSKLFPHNEDKAKSGLYSCPAGWACQVSVDNLHKAMKMGDAGFEVIDPGSGPALAGALSKAYERKQGWLGYYWAPTPLLGKYEMVKVDFGSGTDVEHYKQCITQKDCADPKPTMFPAAPIYTVTTEEFATRAPSAYAYLANRGLSNSATNLLLAWKDENQADGETVALEFLNNSADIWSKWVSKDAANKIKAALAK